MLITWAVCRLSLLHERLMQPSEIIYALRPHMSLPVVLTREKKKFVAWKQPILQKHRISYICGQRELAAEKKMRRKKSVGFWAISAAYQQFYQCVVSAGEEHAVLGIAPSSNIHRSDPVTLSVPNVVSTKNSFDRLKSIFVGTRDG